MGKLLRCSVLHTREIAIPNCKDSPEYCVRTYQIFLPKILCSGEARRRLQKNIVRQEALDENGFHNIGTIPMVFALHGLGTDFQSMVGFAQGANDFHFLLILPAGINNSFNAGDCCGDASKIGIHDGDFLYHVQQQLSEEFNFVQPQYTYGIGWDNGALLLTYALSMYPNLFRAIVPIAGYSTRTWVPSSIGKGIGMMMHHSLDDIAMRPSGCCDDPIMPPCQNDLVSNICVSVLESFDLWAREVNLCTADKYENEPNETAVGTLLVGGQDEFFYSTFYDNGGISLALNTALDEQGEASSTTLATSEVSVSAQTQNGYVCITTSSPACLAASALCLYKDMGHLNGFASTPYMSNHVMEFLARNACGINEGSWNVLPRKIGKPNKRVCGCSTNGFSGVFCLDELDDDSVVKMAVSTPTEALPTIETTTFPTDKSSSSVQPPWVTALVGSLIIVTAAIIFCFCLRLHRKKTDQSQVREQMSDIGRGINPYREHFKSQTKTNTHSSQNKVVEHGPSFRHQRLHMYQQNRQSSRSLDPVDLELLEHYREQSGDNELTTETKRISTERYLDMELLQSYRRRRLSQNIEKDIDSVSSCNSGIYLDENEIRHAGHSDHSDEYVNNILRDVSIS
ncbi:hypothetical protein HJC23_001422 [Cyclotella cryptica]|uniref:Uncharacterized protein n=1 Tax=Cyclotella cryptica TaxID=29204 RepID=A0ABD3NGX6_9STRA|eukprot:CCRYP_021084-RA/>CCRYP_021084-RA protein AED:0.02 eAED:0.02 QI:546/1/1/1/1/1/2/130/625